VLFLSGLFIVVLLKVRVNDLLVVGHVTVHFKLGRFHELTIFIFYLVLVGLLLSGWHEEFLDWLHKGTKQKRGYHNNDQGSRDHEVKVILVVTSICRAVIACFTFW
jgi:hypothetical protein